jgi:NodT family efflux transporter outer membrane factor (OMF) lipoprotein
MNMASRSDIEVRFQPLAAGSWLARLRRQLMLCSCLTLCACVSTDRYPVTELGVPAHYAQGRGGEGLQPGTRVDPLVTYPARNAAADPWWRDFGDRRLDRMIEQVLSVNSDLVAAGLRLKRARLSAGLADTSLLPQLDGSFSAGASKTLEGDDEGSSRSSGARLAVNYELDLWGRLRGLRDIARWEVEATAADREATLLLLISDSTNLYWTLAFLNQRIAAGEASVAVVERTLELVQSQFDAGAISRIELSEAQQSLQSQLAAQSQLRQQRVEARNALSILLDGQPWPVDDEPQDLGDSRSIDIRPGLPAELLGRRPDLRAAEWRLRESLQAVAVERASFYPAISLSGSIGSGGPSLGDVLANPVATLGAGLSLPFLRWRERQLNVDLAGTDYQLAANAFRRTLHTALSEVDAAISARRELALQVQRREIAYAAALRAEAAHEVRYRVGASTLRVWLDAQERRRSAELALAQARLDQLRNAVELVKALGGGQRAD